jgi:hypothetical protein
VELTAPRAMARPRIDIARARFDIERVTRVGGIAGLAVLVAGSFGPWLRSGARSRSSYELFQVADRLGFLGEGALRWLPETWVWVPVLAAIALALHVANRHRLARGVTAAVAIAGLVVSAAVISSPLPAEWGCVAGLAGSFLALASVVGAASCSHSTSPNLPDTSGATPS